MELTYFEPALISAKMDREIDWSTICKDVICIARGVQTLKEYLCRHL